MVLWSRCKLRTSTHTTTNIPSLLSWHSCAHQQVQPHIRLFDHRSLGITFETPTGSRQLWVNDSDTWCGVRLTVELYHFRWHSRWYSSTNSSLLTGARIDPPGPSCASSGNIQADHCCGTRLVVVKHLGHLAFLGHNLLHPMWHNLRAWSWGSPQPISKPSLGLHMGALDL